MRSCYWLGLTLFRPDKTGPNAFEPSVFAVYAIPLLIRIFWTEFAPDNTRSRPSYRSPRFSHLHCGLVLAMFGMEPFFWIDSYISLVLDLVSIFNIQHQS
jgi:hypothetical protein